MTSDQGRCVIQHRIQSTVRTVRQVFNKVIHWHVRERQAWGKPRGGSLVQAVWRRLAEQTPSVACASYEMAYVS